MRMDYEFNKLTDRELLIRIMTQQEQMAKDIQNLNLILSTKAEAAKLRDIEIEVKELQKENTEIKRMQWVATGAVGAAVWVIEHFIVK